LVTGLRPYDGSCYPSGMNFDAALAAHDLRVLSDADPLPDETGFDYDAAIPEQYVDTHECVDYVRDEFDLCWRSVCCDQPA